MKGAATIDGRPGEHLPSLDFDELNRSLEEKHDQPISEEDTMSAALYPKVLFLSKVDLFTEWLVYDLRMNFVGLL